MTRKEAITEAAVHEVAEAEADEGEQEGEGRRDWSHSGLLQRMRYRGQENRSSEACKQLRHSQPAHFGDICTDMR